MPGPLPNYEQLYDLDQVNVMVVGSGGREQALAWKLRQSERIGSLCIVPGSVDLVNFAIDPDNNVKLAIIGPDDALAKGTVDDLTRAGIPTFGPTRQAALIESSKPYAKVLMTQTGVPTAKFRIFNKPRFAHEYIEWHGRPVYVKAGGLALGKGSIECIDPQTAHQAIESIMVDKVFGDAGDETVIEDCLVGDEITLHAICDGETYQMFPSSQDHKKADDGDQGLNTGGMGTISPVPWFNMEQVNSAGLLVVSPVLQAMRRAGNQFNGLLYPGIIVDKGEVNVIEYNARFGDPETQVYMRRLESDLLEIIISALNKDLAKIDIKWSDDYAVCIVAASGGYPGPYVTGKRIKGMDAACDIDGVEVFTAGVAIQDGEYYTSGGRVLGVTAVAKTLESALDLGYKAMDKIDYEGKKFRTDIGRRSIKQQF